MIPFIIAAVGGYLIGDAMKSNSKKMADGGMMAKGGGLGDKKILIVSGYLPFEIGSVVRQLTKNDIPYFIENRSLQYKGAEGVNLFVMESDLDTPIKKKLVIKLQNQWGETSHTKLENGGMIYRYTTQDIESGKIQGYIVANSLEEAKKKFIKDKGAFLSGDEIVKAPKSEVDWINKYKRFGGKKEYKADGGMMADGGITEDVMERIAKKINENKGFEVEYHGGRGDLIDLDVTIFLSDRGYDDIVTFKIKYDLNDDVYHCVSAYYYNDDETDDINFSKEESQKLFGIAEYAAHGIEDEIKYKINDADDMARSYERDDSQDRDYGN